MRVGYWLPAALVVVGSGFAQTVTITEYPVSANAGLRGITAAPDGALWFAEGNQSKIGRMTTSGVLTGEVLIAAALNISVEGITSGPDGALWFTAFSNNIVGRMTTAGQYTLYSVPSSGPTGITTGPDGALWFAESSGSKIGRMTTAGVVTSQYQLTSGSNPLFIVTGSDGALWFTEANIGKIGRLTTTGTLTEFPLPVATSFPWGITAGPDGALWFTEQTANKIGRITTSGAVTEFTIPTANSNPGGITVGPDGALWFTEQAAVGNKIGRITTSGAFTEYPLTANAAPYWITLGPDNALWFTEGGLSKIGRLALNPASTITTVPGGLQVTVDSVTGAAPQTFQWAPGSTHTIATQTPQGSGGTRYVFSKWSDGGGLSHGISAPQSATTYMATFSTQYQLGLSVNPSGAGNVGASPGSADGFYDNGTGLQITATPNSGYSFNGYSGDLNGSAATQSLVMSAPRMVVANFTCAYGLPVTGTTVPASGGGGAFAITAGTGCSWQVTGAPSWVTLANCTPNSGGACGVSGNVASGTGGGVVTFVAAANTSGTPQTAMLGVGGLTYTITQAAPGCSYSLSAPALVIGAAGGPGSVGVTAPAGCAWTVTNVPSWITITGGGQGSGNGTVNFTVAAGGGAPRGATLSIAGLPFVVAQTGGGCTITLTPSQASVPAGGGIFSFTVTASAPDCPRKATVSGSFLNIVTGANDVGSGQVTYSVQANTVSSSRTGTITVGPVSLTVTQAGNGPCTVSLLEGSVTFPAAGGAGSVAVSTQPGCAWTATNAPAFVTVTGGTGTGAGFLTFQVAANGGSSGRVGTVTIGNAVLTIQQAGTGTTVSCAVRAVSPTPVRAEGHTELLQDLVLRCSGTADVGGLVGDVTLKLNTDVTSQKVAGGANTTSALLLVNNPAAVQIGVNAFRGELVGYNTLHWNGVQLLRAGTNVTQDLRIQGVRADASLLGVSNDPAPIVASITAQGAAPLPVTNGTQTVATSGPGLVVSAGQASPGNAGQVVIPVSFQERFAGAFSDGGTRLRLRITGVPAGGQILAPLASTNGNAVLVSADDNGAGGAPVSGTGTQAIVLTNGAGTATWEVKISDPNALEALVFNVVVANAATDTIQMAGTFAPLSQVAVASATAPVPRFRDFSVPQALVNLRTSGVVRTQSFRPVGELAPVTVGSNVTLASTIVNGSDTTAPNVVVSGNLPAGLELTSCNTSTGDPCTATPDGGIRVSLPALLAGDSLTVTVTAAVRASFPNGGVITVEFSASSDLPTADLFASTTAVTFQVSKTCAFALSRVDTSVGFSGDLGEIDVDSAPGCVWTASSPVNWVTVTPAAGSGAGKVRFAVAANTGSSARSATLTVGVNNFTVFQAAQGCTATALVDSTTLAPDGGSMIVTVTTSPAGCAWSASVAPDWMQTSGAAGNGNGGFTVTVSQNAGFYPRTGSIRVAGTTLEIVQQQTQVPPPEPVFSDVPLSHPYVDYITLLRRAGITVGCSPTQYCPDGAVTRGQMAVFIIRSIFGGDIFPYPVTPSFTDVPANHPYFSYIQKMKDLGITVGCSPTTYCPDDPVTRGQMAVFLIRGRLGVAAGTAFAYPAAAYFSDVGTAHPYFSFIQKMKELAITSGCSATTYCPDAATTRGQMAVFLIRAFETP